jgi:fructosamine-3-kinase
MDIDMATHSAHATVAKALYDPELIAIIEHAVEHQWLFPAALHIDGLSSQKSGKQRFYRVQTQAGAFFIKRHRASNLAVYQAEAQALETIRRSQTLATCAPLACSTLGDHSYLILEFLPMVMGGDWLSAGQQLAQMHHHTHEQGYGFDVTTYCGSTPQDNRWQSSWADFFIEQRLQPLLATLARKGIHFAEQDVALSRAAELLKNHQPKPSLLHGDLWSGNIGFNPDKDMAYAVVFDPSSYYGDLETDLAMTELFGRFPQRFYDGYASMADVDAGYEQRRPLYQLYHTLNHSVLFGGAYIEHSRELMTLL